jgi:uncharacterized protein with FMN-binding domain
MAETYKTSSGLKLTTALVTIIVIAGLVLLADHLKADPTAAATATSTASSTSTATDSASNTDMTTSSVAYKDGTYSANEDYFVPPGQESIAVRLTVSNGTVTDVQVTNSEHDRESAIFQQDFAASYKNQVIGKAISSLHISSIAGASDTTDAFNDALSQIRSQAQA